MVSGMGYPPSPFRMPPPQPPPTREHPAALAGWKSTWGCPRVLMGCPQAAPQLWLASPTQGSQLLCCFTL